MLIAQKYTMSGIRIIRWRKSKIVAKYLLFSDYFHIKHFMASLPFNIQSQRSPGLQHLQVGALIRRIHYITLPFHQTACSIMLPRRLVAASSFSLALSVMVR